MTTNEKIKNNFLNGITSLVAISDKTEKGTLAKIYESSNEAVNYAQKILEEKNIKAKQAQEDREYLELIKSVQRELEIKKELEYEQSEDDVDESIIENDISTNAPPKESLEIVTRILEDKDELVEVPERIQPSPAYEKIKSIPLETIDLVTKKVDSVVKEELSKLDNSLSDIHVTGTVIIESYINNSLSERHEYAVPVTGKQVNGKINYLPIDFNENWLTSEMEPVSKLPETITFGKSLKTTVKVYYKLELPEITVPNVTDVDAPVEKVSKSVVNKLESLDEDYIKTIDKVETHRIINYVDFETGEIVHSDDKLITFKPVFKRNKYQWKHTSYNNNTKGKEVRLASVYPGKLKALSDYIPSEKSLPKTTLSITSGNVEIDVPVAKIKHDETIKRTVEYVDSNDNEILHVENQYKTVSYEPNFATGTYTETVVVDYPDYSIEVEGYEIEEILEDGENIKIMCRPIEDPVVIDISKYVGQVPFAKFILRQELPNHLSSRDYYDYEPPMSKLVDEIDNAKDLSDLVYDKFITGEDYNNLTLHQVFSTVYNERFVYLINRFKDLVSGGELPHVQSNADDLNKQADLYDYSIAYEEGYADNLTNELTASLHARELSQFNYVCTYLVGLGNDLKAQAVADQVFLALLSDDNFVSSVLGTFDYNGYMRVNKFEVRHSNQDLFKGIDQYTYEVTGINTFIESK